MRLYVYVYVFPRNKTTPFQRGLILNIIQTPKWSDKDKVKSKK